MVGSLWIWISAGSVVLHGLAVGLWVFQAVQLRKSRRHFDRLNAAYMAAIREGTVVFAPEGQGHGR